ncbi:hypothetical protein NDU88_003237 [Pleurodeles waltl]|uniref:Uncharacterized protein n=1 Tax=Pleurodeles waltl TaxID=8319 RepID=A0AAV7PE31_PLEWA|nr:hypothetical protein NDU88_003237 [Pleurodeles waltl]
MASVRLASRHLRRSFVWLGRPAARHAFRSPGTLRGRACAPRLPVSVPSPYNGSRLQAIRERHSRPLISRRPPYLFKIEATAQHVSPGRTRTFAYCRLLRPFHASGLLVIRARRSLGSPMSWERLLVWNSVPALPLNRRSPWQVPTPFFSLPCAHDPEVCIQTGAGALERDTFMKDPNLEDPDVHLGLFCCWRGQTAHAVCGW